MSNVFDSVFEMHLKAALDKSIADDSYMVAHGNAADYADYRHRCGLIEGFASARKLCDTIHAQLYESEKKDAPK